MHVCEDSPGAAGEGTAMRFCTAGLTCVLPEGACFNVHLPSPPDSLTEDILEVTSKNTSQWYQSIDQLSMNFFAVCLCGDVSDSSCCYCHPKPWLRTGQPQMLSPFSCCDRCPMLLVDFTFPDFF